MDDVIAIKIKDRKRGNFAFMTWGRIFDEVDTATARHQLKRAISRFGEFDPKSVVICDSLQEAAHYPYFYEVLIRFCWKPIPFGKKYKRWKAKTRKLMLTGKEIYLLGSSKKF